MWLIKKPQSDTVKTETFINAINDIKVRLDLIEDDIKRLRKKAKIPAKVDKDSDEDIVKSIEEDGFKEIRELNKQFGGTKHESSIL